MYHLRYIPYNYEAYLHIDYGELKIGVHEYYCSETTTAQACLWYISLGPGRAYAELMMANHFLPLCIPYFMYSFTWMQYRESPVSSVRLMVNVGVSIS